MSLSTTGEFTVKSVRTAGTKLNPHGGTFDKYYVDLLDPEGKPVRDAQGKTDGAYWQRKTPSEVNAGEVVYGTVSEGEYGLRFKAEKRPDGPTSSGGGQNHGSKSNWKPESQYDPEKVARIGRAHAQSMAVQVCIAKGICDGTHGDTEHDLLRKWIDWFQADVDAAAEAAGGGGTASGAPSAAPSQVTHEELHGLLEKAGLNSNAARVVTDYAMTNMSAEEQDAALSMLANSDRAKAAVTRLSEKAEAHNGSPLPSADPDDDLPF